MSNLNISRPPQSLDPWFVEIEQVWNEIEGSVNDNDSRITTLETQIATGVVVSINAQGEPALQGAVVLDASGSVSLVQAGNTITIVGSGVSDHGALTGLTDDDHTQYLLADGTRSLTGNLSFGNNQALSFRVEVLASTPGSGGNQGRLIFNQGDLRLKVDNGTNFVDVGVTDHGLLTGLGDDDHPQYLLVDGSRAVTGNLTVNGIYLNEATESFAMESQEDDGAGAVAFIMDTANALADASAKLLSVRNNGVEVFSIDKDGIATGGLSSPDSVYALIDTDNDSTTEVFSVRKDAPTSGSATVVMEVNEAGELSLPQGTSGLRIGSAGAPSDPLDVDGTANIQGDLTLQAELLTQTGVIRSLTDLIFQMDSNDDETAQTIFQNGAGNPVLTLDENGDLTLVGNLQNTVDALSMLSVETDDALAVAYILDTVNALVTDGALLLSLQNQGTEVFAIDKDGQNPYTPTIYVQPSAGGAGILAAATKLNTLGGGIIQLMPGTYDVGTGLDLSGLAYNNLRIKGTGENTILQHTDVGAGSVATISGLLVGTNDEPVDNVTVDDTDITITTAANAAPYVVGTILTITGTDADTTETVQEIHEVAIDGNDITGVVGLKRQISRNMTGVTLRAWNPTRQIALEDLVLERSSASATGLGLSVTYGAYFTVRNVVVRPELGSTNLGNALSFSNSKGVLVDQCRSNSCAAGAYLTRCYDSQVSGSEFENILTASGEDAGIYIHSGSMNIDVFNNIVKNSNAKGINIFNQAGGNPLGTCDFVRISNNYIEETEGQGIDIGGNRDCIVEGNNLMRCTDVFGGSNVALNMSESIRAVVDGNILKLCGFGIQYTDAQDFIISNNTVFQSLANIDGITGGGALRGTIDGNKINDCSGGISVSLNSDQIVISNNTVTGDIQGAGIRCFGATNIIIDGNMVDVQSGTGSHGIHLDDSGTTPCTDCIVSNNIVCNAAVDGIRIEGVSDCMISNNRVKGSGVDGIGLEDATNPCDQNMISNNHLRGNTGTPIDDNSTGVNNDFLDNKS